MMISVHRLLLLVTALVSATSLVQAQTPVPPGKSTPNVIDASGTETKVDPGRAAVERGDVAARAFDEPEITDSTVFVKSAALGAITEIELAKLAEAKLQGERLKAYAVRMLQDHQALRTELAAIAKRKKLDVPTTLVYEDEQTLKEGAEQSAAEFDGWYARQVIAEHQKAIALYKAAAKMPDADLAAFAKKKLPALMDQQKVARELAGAPQPK